jgi:hypothetical protein
MADETESAADIEPIPPEEARVILDKAIVERLGSDWDNEADGWVLIAGNDFMARLTRGRTNIDFYVDLLGEVRIEEKPINPVQESGRLLAWIFLSLSLAIALLIARIAGVL